MGLVVAPVFIFTLSVSMLFQHWMYLVVTCIKGLHVYRVSNKNSTVLKSAHRERGCMEQHSSDCCTPTSSRATCAVSNSSSRGTETVVILHKNCPTAARWNQREEQSCGGKALSPHKRMSWS